MLQTILFIFLSKSTDIDQYTRIKYSLTFTSNKSVKLNTWMSTSQSENYSLSNWKSGRRTLNNSESFFIKEKKRRTQLSLVSIEVESRI